MAVYRSKNRKPAGSANGIAENGTPRVSNETMRRLAKVMNDSPSVVKLQGTEWEIRGLRMGTQWLISEEAAKMEYREGLSTGDALKEIASNLDSVIFVLTCALLNDKERIFGEHGFSRIKRIDTDSTDGFSYGGRMYSREFGEVFETLKWGEFNPQEWMTVFVEVMMMVDVDFFFESTRLIATVRLQTLQRKEKREEAARQS